jgi:hypothetical protein
MTKCRKHRPILHGYDWKGTATCESCGATTKMEEAFRELWKAIDSLKKKGGK